jgi:polygalacturonase
MNLKGVSMERAMLRLCSLVICALFVGVTAYAAGSPPLATGDSRPLTHPRMPPVCTVLQAQFSTSQRSAVPAADDTSRLQAALDSCKDTGKSVVLAAAGSGDDDSPAATSNAFFSGKLNMSGEALVVGRGVTLFGNDTYTSQLISLTGANAAIIGPGTIDGRGDLITGTPRLINAKNITNFNVFNVTLQHPGKMHLYVEGGNGLTVWGIHITTPANTKNTDGIDIDSLTNATVIGSFIEDGDDGVAVKTNSGPASNITVVGNAFRGTHGMSIGSQTMYGVTNVLWKDNLMYGTDEWGNVATDNNGIRIKSDITCGGAVQQVTYKNTLLVGIKHLLIFNSNYGTCSGVSGVPYYTDIVVDRLASVNSESGAYSEFNGYSAAYPLGLTLENVHLDVTDQKNSQYANVGLFNSNITPSGPGVTTYAITPDD